MVCRLHLGALSIIGPL